MGTPTNIISDSKMETVAERLAAIVQKNLNTTREIEFDYSSGGFTIEGTPDDINLSIKNNYKSNINVPVFGKVGKIKYTIEYQATIEGLPPVIREAWDDIEFAGQSLSQPSTNQSYIWESTNTLSTEGKFDFSDLKLSQSITFKNFSVSIQDVKSPDIPSFTIVPPKVTAPSQEVGFDLNLIVPSTTLLTTDCKDGSDDLGSVYATPEYESLTGVGFSLFPEYQSLTITDLTLDNTLPDVVQSIDSTVDTIQDDWKEYVCKPIEDLKYAGVNLECPKLKLPTIPEVTPALQSTLNQLLSEIDLNNEISPLIKKTWDINNYSSRTSPAFTGSGITCTSGTTTSSEDDSSSSSSQAPWLMGLTPEF